jgi:hypothetical protein
LAYKKVGVILLQNSFMRLTAARVAPTKVSKDYSDNRSKLIRFKEQKYIFLHFFTTLA